MPEAVPVWKLAGFLENLDRRAELESPSDDLRLTVTAWALIRFENPYLGVRREHGFPNLWFGAVPNSADDAGRVVACAYWVEESSRTVRCDSFATLSWPL